MPAQTLQRKRKQSQTTESSTTGFPDFAEKPAFDHGEEVRLSWWERRYNNCARWKSNFFPYTRDPLEDHPNINKALVCSFILMAFCVLLSVVLFPPTFEPRFKSLSPWHVKLHNAWLTDNRIHETTWILDQYATNHTSNDPNVFDEVMLQFPQRNGEAKFLLQDVVFDPKAYYGIISTRKLRSENDVSVETVWNSGRNERVLGVELLGKDVLATTWGPGGTYMLKAWTRRTCEWEPWCKFCLWCSWDKYEVIPAETMRELVDKHSKPNEEDGKFAATRWYEIGSEDGNPISRAKENIASGWFGW